MLCLHVDVKISLCPCRVLAMRTIMSDTKMFIFNIAAYYNATHYTRLPEYDILEKGDYFAAPKKLKPIREVSPMEEMAEMRQRRQTLNTETNR